MKASSASRMLSKPASTENVGALIVLVLGLGVRVVKNVGRRQLALVTGDHELVAPQDRRHRLGRADLARLVEDDDVEVGPIRGQQLGDDQRAHRPAWLERSITSGAAENSSRTAKCLRFLLA